MAEVGSSRPVVEPGPQQHCSDRPPVWRAAGAVGGTRSAGAREGGFASSKTFSQRGARNGFRPHAGIGDG